MDPEALKRGHGSALEEHRLEELTEAVSRDPADGEALIEYGALLFEPFHQEEQARPVLERAAEVLPHDGRPLFWLANIAMHRDCDDAAAQRYVEAALVREPNRPECLSLLISALIDQPSERVRCRELAEKLVAVAPDWPMAHRMRADVLIRTGQVQEAERALRTALELAERPVAWDVPDNYFEEVETGRRSSAQAINSIRERLAALRHRDVEQG
jgi:Flp pilus assembly protein TadD